MSSIRVEREQKVDGATDIKPNSITSGDMASGVAVPSSRAITAGTGLTGGGDLSADRSLAVAYGTSGTTACVGNDARLSDARTPSAHAASHNAGGSDALAIDAAAGTGSLRTLGTSATSACAGNDARLSDARTPTAHTTSHKHGGSDEVATATAAANAIPKAGSGGKLGVDWLPQFAITSSASPVTVPATGGHIRVVGGAGAKAVAMPASAGVAAGTPVTVKDAAGNASGGTITITADGSDTIDGSATKTITADWGLVRMIYAGSGKWETC